MNKTSIAGKSAIKPQSISPAAVLCYDFDWRETGRPNLLILGLGDDKNAKRKLAMLMKNSERALVRILREVCCEYEIEYQSFSHDWVFRLMKNGESRVVFGYGFPLNSATSAAVCTDKAAASALIAGCGVPCVHHRFFMHPSGHKYTGGHGNWMELAGMLKSERMLVLKPNEGTGGNQIYRVDSLAALENATAQIFSSNRSMAVCRYYDIHSEHRVVLLHGRALVIYEKKLPFVTGDGHSTIAVLVAEKYPTHEGELLAAEQVLARGENVSVGWMHNLGRGAAPKLVDLSSPIAKRLEKLAVDAAAACGVRFASVDIVDVDHESTRQSLVLEINSGVMMEAFAAVSDEFYEIAKDAYRKALLAMW